MFRLELKTCRGEVARAAISEGRVVAPSGASPSAPSAVFVGDRFFVRHKAYVDGDGVVWTYEEDSYVRIGVDAVDGDWRRS